jgi:hypothetical protein
MTHFFETVTRRSSLPDVVFGIEPNEIVLLVTPRNALKSSGSPFKRMTKPKNSKSIVISRKT